MNEAGRGYLWAFRLREAYEVLETSPGEAEELSDDTVADDKIQREQLADTENAKLGPDLIQVPDGGEIGFEDVI